MSFELEADKPLGDSIRAVIFEEIDGVLDQLAAKMDADHRDKTIHESRKSLKRLRAAVCLMRGEIGDEIYRRERRAFRDAAKPMSQSRDAKVLLDAFDGLLEHFQGEVQPEAFAPLRQILEDRRRQSRDVLSDQMVLQIIADLQAARQRIETWPLRRDSWSALDGGLRALYASGRDALDDARKNHHEESFHDWRKRSKELWHSLELLSPVWPEMLGPLADQVHQLADYLGDEHDLSVLKQTIRDDPGIEPHRGAADTLVGLADKRRLQLQSSALTLGRKIFCERPRRFAGRLESYWNLWRVKPQAPAGSPDITSPGDTAPAPTDNFPPPAE